VRKIYLFAAAGLLVLVLAACGGADSTANLVSDISNDEVEANGANEEEKNETKEDEEERTLEISDTTLETDQYTFVIQEVEQLTSQYDETEILALEIEFSNHSDDTRTPWLAAATSITAEQETEDEAEVLNGANAHFPDDYKEELVNKGSSGVESGDTVEAVIGYEIIHPGEPVRLVDFSLFEEPAKFERVIETEG
jgi:hypothetical protein